MSTLKQQFVSMRDSTPKHIQWLLLAAAFVVVLILLTLLLTGPKRKPTVKTVDDIPVDITLTTAGTNGTAVPVDTVNWADVTIGTRKSEKISVTSNVPAKVSIEQNKTIAGFTAKNTCIKAAVINTTIPCDIFLEYEPTLAMKPEPLSMYVYYRGENEPEGMESVKKITIILGASAPEQVIVPKPEPVVLPEPEPEDDYYDDEPAPQIRREVETLAPDDPFTNQVPVDLPMPSMPEFVRPSESCSDFAFPGYDSYGNQIGWIKPEGGGYYFYTFSDKNCKNPTGVYNPNTGIITDINSSGKKIGTDAEHINTALATGLIPTLSESPKARSNGYTSNETATPRKMGKMALGEAPVKDVDYDTTDTNAVVSTQPYDRTFILRQYKPIPATIVSDVRADTVLDEDNMHFPVRATVDRNVYSDNGRTIIIPTGTLLLGYVTGKVPGPYKAIGRMNIKWYQFVLPNGVEFNFNTDQQPISADAQGRIGVPGRGSTDYMEQFVMPMLTSIVPAAVNMIAPVADKFVNQIDLDNNTVVQSGTLRSSELAKNEIITAWNQVAQKLLVDMMDNTVPPFTIPAGTRITVYSANDLMVACTTNEKCIVKEDKHEVNNKLKKPNLSKDKEPVKPYADYGDGTWVGQARSFKLDELCEPRSSDGVIQAKPYASVSAELQKLGYSYSTLVAYCQSSNYTAINNAKQAALYQNQQDSENKNSIASKGGVGSQTYNEQVLGLTYDENGAIQNPFQEHKSDAPEEAVLKCGDGANPDSNGCCAGEVYTDMGELGFNCCPTSGGDCFPPIL